MKFFREVQTLIGKWLLGECLSEHDTAFLEKVFNDANHFMPPIGKHPELQPTATRAVSLYKEITEKALENEKQS